jgi:two-component system, OmpR family, response regulator QseB
MRILILEDDVILSNGLMAGLALHGMAADCVETCEDAITSLATTAFDATVLDLMLPDGSGLSVLRHLRSRDNAIPVLVLTARDGVGDRITGLDQGADDYMAKPFDLDELAARLRALIRRSAGRASSRLVWGNLELSQAERSVTREGASINLSRREFDLLEALMLWPGRVCPRDRLEERLYGWQEEIESNALEVHIHNLRAKIGRRTIETVRGLGYRMRKMDL